MVTRPPLRFIFDARVAARDGVELSCDVYLPPEGSRFPAILHRTPYDNSSRSVTETAQYFARRGYAFVAADVRGRGDSDGRFSPFRGEGPDGYDTIEWIAHQPWSTGRIGMMGGSYASSVQWVAARLSPPHLVTMVSTATSGRQVQDPPRRGKLRPSQFLWLHAVGGHTMQLGQSADDGGPDIDWQGVLTHRPLEDMDLALGRTNTAWREWMEHRDDVGHWTVEDQYHSYDRIGIPVLHITGWYDGSVVGELETYAGMQADSPAGSQQQLLIGPWDHAGTRTPAVRLGHREFGQNSLIDINELHLRWFDRYLRGNSEEPALSSPVRIYVMGADEWRDLADWPPPDSVSTPYFLRSAGGANGAGGDGFLSWDGAAAEPADHYLYDPEDATPSVPQTDGIFWGSGALDHVDHTFAEHRPDVLVYTSEPLTEDLEVIGHPGMELWAASDAVDTDFSAVLAEVDESGRSTIISEGLVRASYRRPDRAPSPIEPGRVYRYWIPMNPTAHVFLRGRRVRVCIASAQFPAYDRNPNTGARLADDTVMRRAHQTVHHSGEFRSALVLPVHGVRDGSATRSETPL
jgi:putative CocE/NonD family hydrolase